MTLPDKETLPCKADSINSDSPADSLLLRLFGGDSGKVAKFRSDMDRREAARLRMAIARGAEHDKPAGDERPVVVIQSPAAAPAIDKAKLASWMKSEIQQTVRAEMAAIKQEIEVNQAEAIIEGMKRLEDRR